VLINLGADETTEGQARRKAKKKKKKSFRAIKLPYMPNLVIS